MLCNMDLNKLVSKILVNIPQRESLKESGPENIFIKKKAGLVKSYRPIKSDFDQILIIFFFFIRFSKDRNIDVFFRVLLEVFQ